MCRTYKFITGNENYLYSVDTKQLDDTRKATTTRVINKIKQFETTVVLKFKAFGERLTKHSDNNDIVLIGYEKLDGEFKEAVVKVDSIDENNGDRKFINLEEKFKNQHSYSFRAMPQTNIKYVIHNLVKYVNGSDRKTIKV